MFGVYMIDIMWVCVYENHKTHKILSEWLLFNTSGAIFQLYNGENKLHFNEMMMPALYLTNRLRWIFIVLAHWNNSPRVDMWCSTKTHYSDSEPINLCPYSLMWCAKRKDANTNCIVFGLVWPYQDSNP